MKKYQILYADPPWDIGKGGKKSVRPNSSGGKLDYPVISLKDIEQILFNATLLSASDCNLFLWTIDKYLFEAQRMAENIAYKLHARMVWDKVTGIPASFDIRFGHEYLLWLYRGKLQPVALDERGKIHSVFREQVTKHSKKPEIAYRIIERLYPETTRLELFARQKRDGWDCWGNEVESDIEL
jgi:N6-adenosine-specific RNA methylase IME4